jgi:hypothetical protein
MTILYKRHVLTIFANALAKRAEEVEIRRAAIQRAWPGPAAVQQMLLEPGMSGWMLHDRIGPTERDCVCVFRRAKPYPVRVSRLAAE